jgi:DNA primase
MYHFTVALLKGKRTKRIFVDYSLQMFNEGTTSGPADMVSVFSFSPHDAEQAEGII